jgi:diphthamide biosynthesis protein 7
MKHSIYQSEVRTESAVLDIQWAPKSTGSSEILAVAQSTGVIAFYKLNTSNDNGQDHHSDGGTKSLPAASLQLLSTHRICESSILVLSLTWSPRHPQILGMTLSDGGVSIAQVCIHSQTQEDASQSLHLLELGYLIATQHHDLEAWCMTFGLDSDESQHPPSKDDDETKALTTISGGDDMRLHSGHGRIPATTIPSPSLSDDSPPGSMIFQDRRIHTAGVTALLPLTSNLLITGSYDDHIRLLHIPSTSSTTDGGSERRGPMRPQVLAELQLGGGVWRIKFLEEGDTNSTYIEPWKLQRRSILLLVSCMHAGTRISRLVQTTTGDAGGEGEWEFRIEAQFTEHKSMNYGSDVQPSSIAEGGQGNIPEGVRQTQRRTIVSTSFYDKLLCLWRWEG